eukprot:jgi/Mesvir1/29263/Mv08181-RA.2
MEGFVLRRVQEIERSSKTKGNTGAFPADHQGNSENRQPNVPSLAPVPNPKANHRTAVPPHDAAAPCTPARPGAEGWGHASRGTVGRVSTPHHSKQPLLYPPAASPAPGCAAWHGDGMLATQAPEGVLQVDACQTSTMDPAHSTHDALAYAGATPARTASLPRAPLMPAGAPNHPSILFSPLSAPARRVRVRPKTPSAKPASSMTPQGSVRRALGLSAHEPLPHHASPAAASQRKGGGTSASITSQPAPRPAWVNPAALVHRHVSFVGTQHKDHAGGPTGPRAHGSASRANAAAAGGVAAVTPDLHPAMHVPTPAIDDADHVAKAVPGGVPLVDALLSTSGSQNGEWEEEPCTPRVDGGDASYSDVAFSGAIVSVQGGSPIAPGDNQASAGSAARTLGAAYSSMGTLGLGGAAVRVQVAEDSHDDGTCGRSERTPARPAGPGADLGGSLAALFRDLPTETDKSNNNTCSGNSQGLDSNVSDAAMAVTAQQAEAGAVQAMEVAVGGSAVAALPPPVLDSCRAVLTPVRASKVEQRLLGTQTILTPVRRSCRTVKPVGWEGFDTTTAQRGRGVAGASTTGGAAPAEPMLEDLLEQTGYTYTPNKALRGANMYLHPPPRRPRPVSNEGDNGAGNNAPAVTTFAATTTTATASAAICPPPPPILAPLEPVKEAPLLLLEASTRHTEAGAAVATTAAGAATARVTIADVDVVSATVDGDDDVGTLAGNSNAAGAATTLVSGQGPADAGVSTPVRVVPVPTLQADVPTQAVVSDAGFLTSCGASKQVATGEPGWELAAFARMMAAVARAALRQQAQEEAGGDASSGNPPGRVGADVSVITPACPPSACGSLITKAPVKGKRTPRARKPRGTPAFATLSPLPLAQALATPLPPAQALATPLPLAQASATPLPFSHVLVTPGTPEVAGVKDGSSEMEIGNSAGWNVSPEVIFGGEIEAKQATGIATDSRKAVKSHVEGLNTAEPALIAVRRSARKIQPPSALLHDFDCTMSARKAHGRPACDTRDAPREPVVSSLASQLEEAGADVSTPKPKTPGRKSRK